MQDMSELTRAQLRRKFERLSKADDALRERQKEDSLECAPARRGPAQKDDARFGEWGTAIENDAR